MHRATKPIGGSEISICDLVIKVIGMVNIWVQCNVITVASEFDGSHCTRIFFISRKQKYEPYFSYRYNNVDAICLWVCVSSVFFLDAVVSLAWV